MSMNNFLGKVKVPVKVKPIPYFKRPELNLYVGANYYVSFGKNEAYPCKLVAIDNEREQIAIEIPVKSNSKRGIIGLNGQITYNRVSAHNLYKDEIGHTPEEAVRYQVTN